MLYTEICAAPICFESHSWEGKTSRAEPTAAAFCKLPFLFRY